MLPHLRRLWPVLLLASLVRANDALPRVNLTVVDIKAPRYLPAILAEKLGYYRDEGLTVTLMDEREDVPTDQQLRDGRTDACVGFYHHTFLSQAEGISTECVLALAVTPGLKVLAPDRLKDQIHSLTDFHSRRIVIGGKKSSKNIIANYLVVRGGGKSRDYVAVDGKGSDKVAESLASGKTDLVVATEPDVSYYLAHGCFVAADLTSVGGTQQAFGAHFPTTCLYLSNPFVAAHPETVQHLVRALARTLKYLAHHTPEEVAALMPKEIVGPDAAVYLKTLRESMQMFATDGVLASADAQKELEVMAAFDPKFKAVKLDQTYTNRFADAAVKNLP